MEIRECRASVPLAKTTLAVILSTFLMTNPTARLLARGSWLGRGGAQRRISILSNKKKGDIFERGVEPITAIECGLLLLVAVFMPFKLTADGRPPIERLAETNLLPAPDRRTDPCCDLHALIGLTAISGLMIISCLLSKFMPVVISGNFSWS